MLREFVVLEHSGASDGDHFDLMIMGADGGKLLTWRVGRPPEQWTDAEALGAVRIADHRSVYLTYEGEISGGRGRVRRVSAGWVPQFEEDGDGWRIRLEGIGANGVEVWLPRGNPVVGGEGT